MPAAHGKPHAQCWPHGGAHAYKALHSCLRPDLQNLLPGSKFCPHPRISVSVPTGQWNFTVSVRPNQCADRTIRHCHTLSKLYWATTAVSGAAYLGYAKKLRPGAHTRVIDKLLNCNPMLLQIVCFATLEFLFHTLA